MLVAVSPLVRLTVLDRANLDPQMVLVVVKGKGNGDFREISGKSIGSGEIF